MFTIAYKEIANDKWFLDFNLVKLGLNYVILYKYFMNIYKE